MKKVLLSLLVVFLITGVAYGFEVDTTRTFSWEQDLETLSSMTHWELHWSDTAGGPYVKLFEIPTVDVSGTGTDPVTLHGEYTITVEGQTGKIVRKYFVLRAVVVDGTSPNVDLLISDWSNEVYSDFKITPGKPFNLKVSISGGK